MDLSLIFDDEPASLQNLIYILGSVLLLLFAFIRFAEAAFIRIPSGYIDDMEKPKPADYRIDDWLDKPASVLVAFSLLKYIFLLGFLFCFYIFVLGLGFFTEYWHVFFVSVAAAFIPLWFFGEIIPSLFGKLNPIASLKLSFFLVVPTKKLLDILRFVLPLSYARHEKRLPRKETISISEISDVIENSEDEPEEETEKRLIKGVLSFGDLEVKEIMRSRIDVVAINNEAPFNEMIGQIVEAGYSRYPVYGEGLDDIKGVLYLKDILEYIDEKDSFEWQKHLRPAFFVPENLKITQLLLDFQTKKIHMAVIVDEYGGTSGIVTLEDILEEIVGEINDEHDSESDEILARKIGDEEYIFDSKISLIDFSKFTGLDPDIFEEYESEAETIAGIILLVNGNFPVKNQQIQYKNLEFTVLSMDNRRIQNIKVKIHEVSDEE